MTRKKAPTDPPDDEPEKKERVLHTRVPESLETHLRERAEDLGISVSNLVRNVLGHAFGLVGDVVADSHAIAKAARGGTRQPAATPAAAPVASIDDVLGWQPIVLGKNAVCARCNALLPKGRDAAIGVGTSLVICPPCLEELRA
ncbi:MAG: hypothetical protein H0T89_21570 [Deltaproteobacteria bacterium]|nr:hypothetical protein [Deltaproteobacteria bacterium]